MAGETFFRGTLTYNAIIVGAIDVSFKETNTEHNVTTLETVWPESDYKAGRRVYDVSFTVLHKANTANLATRLILLNEAVFTLEDETGASNTYTGNLTLYTSEVKSAQDGRDEIAYTGKYNGAVPATKAAASE